MKSTQDWLKWDPISQEDRQASLDRAADEEAAIEEDYQLMLKREEEARLEAEEKRKAEELAAQQAAMDWEPPEEWSEEEDDLDPWDLPTTDPDYSPNPLWGPDGIKGTDDDITT